MLQTDHDTDQSSPTENTIPSRPEPAAEAEAPMQACTPLPMPEADAVPAKPLKPEQAEPADRAAGEISATDPEFHNRVSDKISSIQRGRQSIWRRLRNLIFGK
jgi:hypothetical protein